MYGHVRRLDGLPRHGQVWFDKNPIGNNPIFSTRVVALASKFESNEIFVVCDPDKGQVDASVALYELVPLNQFLSDMTLKGT